MILINKGDIHIMENQNIDTKQLENSSIPFVNHFSKLRENPKWLVKLLILIVLAIITAFVSYFATKRFCIITI